MKKKILVLAIVSLMCVSAFAAVEGRTSVGLNYSYNDGNFFGLTTDTVGFINDCPVGYYIGTDADFGIGNVSAYKIQMQFAPVYRYMIANTAMSIDLALGLSASYVEADLFKFGIGGYLGAEYRVSDIVSLMVGAKMGSDFVNIPLESNPEVTVDGDFYVTPYLAVGFCY